MAASLPSAGETDSPPPYRSRSPSISSEEDDNDDSELSSNDDEPEDDLCTVCEEQHVRRRLIICVDGTWMMPDGAIGSFNGNASNMFRIWCMVKTGRVYDSQGRPWEQIRAPFIDGVGATDDFVQRVYEGVTGSGFERKIMQAYKLCCSLCESDEIFLFGYSRGAFIVRAVCGLLYHMRALRPDLPDFDKKFFEGLRIYRAAQDKSRLQMNSVFRYLSENTRPPARVKYIGLIDTVKALEDFNLYDISSFESASCIRHALALFEKRTVMSPERFDLNATRTVPDLSVQEAWFAGTHGDLGGSCKQDGLAMWPLQWLMMEAQGAGLRIGFKWIERCPIVDPADLIQARPGDELIQCVGQDGIVTRMADLTHTHNREGFYPEINSQAKSFPSPKEFREVFEGEQLVGGNAEDEQSQTGCFIHPSVFLLDHTEAAVVQTINTMPCAKLLRAQQQHTSFPSHSMFWALQRELGLRSSAEHPRIMVCGQTHSGKTSLIDAVLQRESSAVSHGASQGEHSIAVELRSSGSRCVFHDSQGFQSGDEGNYELVQDFLTQRRQSHHFTDHVHSVWYCVSTDLPRIQKSDRKFGKLDFGSVPVVLVFTKYDKMILEKTSEALAEYNSRNRTRVEIENIGSLPAPDKASIQQRADELLTRAKQKLEHDWNRRVPVFASSIFVTTPSRSPRGQGFVDTLEQLSSNNMSSERVRRIHAEAQENKIQSLLEKMVSETISVCNDKADWWSCFKRSKLDVYRRELVGSAISNAARIFQFEGFKDSTLSDIIGSTMFPFPEEQGSIKRRVGAFFGGVAIAAVAEIVFPPLILLWLPALVGGHSFKSLSNSNIMVLAFVEVLLVFDRIFWYGDRHIEEKHVRAALLYYLKIRPHMVETFMRSIDRTDSISKMGPKLTAIIEQFRYRRVLAEPETAGSDDALAQQLQQAADDNAPSPPPDAPSPPGGTSPRSKSTSSPAKPATGVAPVVRVAEVPDS